MRHLIYIFCFLTLTVNETLAQWELVETMTAAEISAAFGVPATYDVNSYKVIYPTTNIDGTAGMASGLISVPQSSDFKFPLLVIQHGTVGSRTDVPSELGGGHLVGVAMAGIGFMSIQPDYLGLGVNEGTHPYVHADSEAWVAVDMMRYLRDNLEEEFDNQFFINDQVFVGGYSQGGHASMALHRSLETDLADEFTVTGASHMSGPYSISEEMVNFTLGDDEYGFSAYLAWTSLSAKVAFPDLLVDFEIEDIFKAPYAEMVRSFEQEEFDLWALNEMFEEQLMLDVGAVVPRAMLFDEIVDALKNDPDHPLSQALAMNDVYDWAPKAPTRILYCTGDDQVTYKNAELAEQVMLANGSTDVVAIQQGATFDHGQCFSPCLSTTLFFFLSLREFTVDVDDTGLPQYSQMLVAQHGTEMQIMIDPKLLDKKDLHVQMMDIMGQNLIEAEVTTDNFALSTLNMPSGMHLIRLFSGRKVVDQVKVFVK